MAYLVLVRHGLSDYNKQGLWTGWADPPLAPEGIQEANRLGELLSDIRFDFAYQSPLKRVRQTTELILEKNPGGDKIPVIEDSAINERNYGDFTGKNKWQIKEEVGQEQFHKIRRGWDHPIPNGETLKDVYTREVPYFEKNVFPLLKQGKNVIFCSSHNALRALIKHLENIPDDKIAELEMGTGEAYVYSIDTEGKVVGKEIRGENPNKGKI
jgi:2,3-bisphosphoglycerate-dependent phosphoglycerate mutase